jgi:serine/threonine-protein kinase RsbW
VTSSGVETSGTETLRVGDRVELVFPARGDLVVLARLVTSALSARAGFDIEELEDLRLAVGELCLLSLQGSDARHGDIRFEFTVFDDVVEVVCTLVGAAAPVDDPTEAMESEQLSEQILSALVDEYGREHNDGSVKAWLRKQRRGHVT